MLLRTENMRNWSNKIFKSTVNFLGYFILSFEGMYGKVAQKNRLLARGESSVLPHQYDIRISGCEKYSKHSPWYKSPKMNKCTVTTSQCSYLCLSMKKCVLLSLLLIIMQHVWFFKTVPYLFSNTTKKSPSNYELVG